MTSARPRQSRATGYHNAVHEDDAGVNTLPNPPNYARACASRRAVSAPLTTPSVSSHEPLPPYTCTLNEASPVSVKYERTSPFEVLHASQWADVYIVLHGTRLSLHQVQQPGIFSKANKRCTAGKLLRSYSLQHAEVGVASDCKKYALICRSPMTAFLPQAVQEKMKETEPHLFEPVRQYILRLRVECDQILLRLKSWDERAMWIDKLCAAIDIAPPLDERSEPKYHTLPRRRHRTNRVPAEAVRVRLNNLVEEQERIIRESFPQLLEQSQTQGRDGEQEPEGADTTADPDAEDLDTSVVRGEDQEQEDRAVQEETAGFIRRFNRMLHAHALTTGRPMVRLQTPTAAESRSDVHTTITRPPQPLNATGSIEAVPRVDIVTGKLPPTTQLDISQDARYRRRCMPSLLINSRRANDIVVHNGCRWKIDWDTSVLKPYPEPPPCYSEGPAEEGEERDVIAVPTISFSERPLKTSKSCTTVNDSAGSSVEEGAGGGTRRLLKATMGSWGRRIRSRKQETNESGVSCIVEEKADGKQPIVRQTQTGISEEASRIMGI